MKRSTKLLALLALTLPLLGLLTSCEGAKQSTYYTQRVDFPEGATLDTKVEMASQLIPSEKQQAWQELELTAFIHFGVNTFTNQEWGDGTEDPAIFVPEHLDTDQWVRTLKDAGFRLVILTCKHHDGFCLWQTETTDHSVKASPWRNGEGDVLRDLSASCKKYDMKLGVYLSPWDRNAASYGTGKDYNDLYIAQLTELLSDYGDIDEVWFDGACGEGPNGKVQEYDWERVFETIHKLQPNAVSAIMGEDIRWVGNESGLGRETEWSATVLAPDSYPESDSLYKALDINAMSEDLGSREMLAKAGSLYWYPSEVDVSIRPGWFWHPEEEPKTLKQLSDIYLQSVGRNSVLLLNIPPTRDGLLDERDVKRVGELGQWIRQLNEQRAATEDLAHEIRVGGSVVTELDPDMQVGVILLQEDISRGQRVEKFHVDGLMDDGTWSQIAKGTTIGYKRLLPLEVQAKYSKIRLVIDEGRGSSVFIRHINALVLPPLSSSELADDMPGITPLPKQGWTVSSVSPLEILFGKELSVQGLIYTPAKGRDATTLPFTYLLEGTEDGKSWQPLARGEFSNIVNNPIPQKIKLDRAYSLRGMRLTGTTVEGHGVPLEESEIVLY